VVVTGSLYLIRQLFALKNIRRTREPGTRRPGRAQLYRYSQLARQNKLSKAERREFKEARRHFELSPHQSPVFSYWKHGRFSLRSKNTRKKRLRIIKLRWSKETRELQSKAAFHRKQRLGYRQTIRTLKNDSEMAQKNGEGLGGPAENLLARIEDLENQATKHMAEYNDAMTKLRGYKAEPHMKYMSHRTIFGYVKKPKAPTKSPFAAEEKPGKPGRKPAMARKDRKESFSEELVAAEKKRELAAKEAARREAAKNSSDPLGSKLAADRKDTGSSNDL
jgi:folylpolyglutamate synthase